MYCVENIKRSLKFLKEGSGKLDYKKFIDEHIINTIENKFRETHGYENYF